MQNQPLCKNEKEETEEREKKAVIDFFFHRQDKCSPSGNNKCVQGQIFSLEVFPLLFGLWETKIDARRHEEAKKYRQWLQI
jgi:hypothetical protein